MKMKIEINIKRKHFYGIIVLLIVGFFIMYTIGTPVKKSTGSHPLQQIAVGVGSNPLDSVDSDANGFIDNSDSCSGDSVCEANNLYVSGNVGIGTNNPQAKLDVNGDVHITGNLKVPSYVCSGSGPIPGGKAIYAANPNGAVGIYANTDATDGGAIDVAGNNCAINPGGVEVTLGQNGRFQINRWTGSGYDVLFNLNSNDNIHITGDICTDAGGGKCLSSIGEIIRIEKEYRGDPPNNDAYALFCPEGYMRVTCQNWRERPLLGGGEFGGIKLAFKAAFTDDYPALYSPGGCVMSYCGPDNSYVCRCRITCIRIK